MIHLSTLSRRMSASKRTKFLMLLLWTSFLVLHGDAQIRYVPIVSTIAGTGAPGNSNNNGQATAAQIRVDGLCVDEEKNIVYFSDATNNVVRFVNRNTGTIHHLAGLGSPGTNGDGGNASIAQLNSPVDVAVNSVTKMLYIADSMNRRVRQVNLKTGIISNFAGDGTNSDSGDGGFATIAKMSNVVALNVENSTGHVFVTTGYSIRVVNATTSFINLFAFSTIVFWLDHIDAKQGRANNPQAIAIDNIRNLVFIADRTNNRVRMVNRNTGALTTMIGSGLPTNEGDGAEVTVATTINAPKGMAMDVANNLLFISSPPSHRIRMVNRTSNIISTIAGTGMANSSGDGGLATLASFNFPGHLAYDSKRSVLYIADGLNHKIRMISFQCNFGYFGFGFSCQPCDRGFFANQTGQARYIFIKIYK